MQLSKKKIDFIDKNEIANFMALLNSFLISAFSASHLIVFITWHQYLNNEVHIYCAK